MKTKILILSAFILVCCFLGSCGKEPMRPVDYPDTSWVCESDRISFSVSEDGKITNAVMTDINGEKLDISLVFSDMSEGKVSITNADGSETYFPGTCTYGEDMFSVFVTDIYSSDISVSSTRLVFERR